MFRSNSDFKWGKIGEGLGEGVAKYHLGNCQKLKQFLKILLVHCVCYSTILGCCVIYIPNLTLLKYEYFFGFLMLFETIHHSICAPMVYGFINIAATLKRYFYISLVSVGYLLKLSQSC